MSGLGQELRQALRALRGAAGLASAVVGVGGASLAALALVLVFVSAFLLRPLPYPDAERLVWLQSTNGEDTLGVSHADYEDWKHGLDAFESLAAFDARNHMVLSLGDGAESILVTRTVSDLFATLGVEPAIGRAFDATADRPGGEQVALLSHDLWSRRFAADARVLGENVELDGAPYTVIGVMPAGFRFPVRSDVWVPSSAWADQWPHRSIRVDSAIGRLRPGADLATAGRAATALAERLADEHPESNASIGIALTPLREVWTAASRQALLLLLVACVLLLTIAAANATSLLLVWASRRRHELVMRLALGASPGRLLRQRLIENGLLGLAAGAVGLALAWLTVGLAGRLLPAELPTWITLRLEPVVAATVLTLGVVYGLAVGILATSRVRPHAAELLGRQRGDTTRASLRLRRGLAAGQVALALVLMVAAGLMAASLHSLGSIDPGFDPDGVLTLEIDLPAFSIESYAQVSDLYRRIDEEVGALPVVEASALTTSLPLGGQETWHLWELTLEDQSEASQRTNPRVHGQGVSGDYFAALDVPIVDGHRFESADLDPATPGVIVSRSLAHRLWPGRPPLGRRLKLGPPSSPAPLLTVVGIAGDVRYDSLAQDGQLDLYLPLERLPSWPIHLVAETSSSPLAAVAEVRQAVWKVSPDLGLRAIQPYTDHLAASTWRQRTWATLFGVFSALALALALAGVFALVSHLVETRRGEIAVRVTLGARRSDIVRHLVAEVLRLVAVGVTVGATLALLATRFLSSQLFAVSAADPAVYATAAVVLVAAALAACVLPMVRAMRVDPRAHLQSL